ncbi:MAG: hypothetical protein HQ509_08250 [Candidatus Marinimicrobia bacterium]|nr:hypothetical protein [Candidatus Neomarinimicrobiota bacterium]
MNKLILVIGVILSSTLMACDCCKSNNTDQTATTTQSEIMTEKGHDMMGKMDHMEMDTTVVYYTCPMKSHKHIHSSESGKCTKCGMTLVKAEITTIEEAEFYGCPMESHSHVRSAEEGACTECGMKLMPMELNKK